MRSDIRIAPPRLSVKNPRKYKQLWVAANRDHVREYNTKYMRKRRKALRLAKKNGG